MDAARVDHVDRLRASPVCGYFPGAGPAFVGGE
jgi:hypothetical protein